MADHPEREAANVIRLLLFTGARSGETKRATWNQFDLRKGVWTKPSSHTKTQKTHRVPLAAPARDFLIAMRDEAERRAVEYNAGRAVGQPKREPSPYLFPGRGTDGPITDIKNSWATVCKAARLEGVRIHDLRHSIASILINEGLSLPIVGQLLGHTQPQTTKRYAHIADKPLREAAERVGAVVTGKNRRRSCHCERTDRGAAECR